MHCLTVAVGLEEGREVGVDVVGMDVGVELGVADGCKKNRVRYQSREKHTTQSKYHEQKFNSLSHRRRGLGRGERGGRRCRRDGRRGGAWGKRRLRRHDTG